MELKQGYKPSELGLIPEDWDVNILENLTSKIGSGITPKGGSNVYKEFGRPLVRSQNVGWGNLLLSDIAFIDDEIHQTFPNTQIYIKDVFLNISGASIGRSSIANEKLVGGNVNQHVCIIRTLKHYLDANYLNKFLLSKKGQKQIDSFQSGGNRQGLNIGQIRTFQIPLPPLPEQKAISQVLSDTDNLIQAIEQKLSKKRAVKQGAMQQLLTPKEDWEVKKLPEVCWFQEGPGLRNWQFTKKGMKVINVTNLVNGYLNLDKTDRHISMNEFEKMYKHFEIDENDIVMASSGNSYSKVAVVRKQDLRLLMNTSVIRFKPLDGLDYNYLLIFLKSKIFKDQIDLLITGGAQPNFGPFHLKKIDIAIPSTMEEQIHISTILSDMEIEIEQIVGQLSKYKLLKQGLMQNLLTGKIRLV